MDDARSGVVGWIREIVLDTPDPWELARFWAGLLGGTPVEWYPGWVTLEPPPRGRRLSFQATGAGRQDAPAAARLVHFDILVGDLAAAHERVLARGRDLRQRAHLTQTRSRRPAGAMPCLPRSCRPPILPSHPVTTRRRRQMKMLEVRRHARGAGTEALWRS
ncbi:MAG: VOC family protein [Streptosporangiaceae bacterium]